MITATIQEINMRGIEALKQALDPVELVRFFQQYEKGSGNYTKERKKNLQKFTIKQISDEIKVKKSSSNNILKARKKSLTKNKK